MATAPFQSAETLWQSDGASLIPTTRLIARTSVASRRREIGNSTISAAVAALAVWVAGLVAVLSCSSSGHECRVRRKLG